MDQKKELHQKGLLEKRTLGRNRVLQCKPYLKEHPMPRTIATVLFEKGFLEKGNLTDDWLASRTLTIEGSDEALMNDGFYERPHLFNFNKDLPIHHGKTRFAGAFEVLTLDGPYGDYWQNKIEDLVFDAQEAGKHEVPSRLR